jgi:coenzyme PQQ precursor peptide PqqA
MSSDGEIAGPVDDVQSCRGCAHAASFDGLVARVFSRPGVLAKSTNRSSETMKKWSKPAFQNMRYGFEINLYVKVR